MTGAPFRVRIGTVRPRADKPNLVLMPSRDEAIRAEVGADMMEATRAMLSAPKPPTGYVLVAWDALMVTQSRVFIGEASPVHYASTPDFVRGAIHSHMRREAS